LLDEVRRAENREGIDFASVNEFAQDETGLDGFANADIIGYEKAWHLEAQRHQKRDKLIDAWLERKLGGGTERAGTTTESQAQCVREQRGF
jgi:hypothetical protein